MAVSPATCLRRVKRLVESGVVERRVAILSPDKLGAGLSAILEVTLDRQGAEHLDAFEARAVQEAAVRAWFVTLMTPATLSVQTQPQGAGALVFVDGEPRGTTPATIPIDPGAHRVAIRAGDVERTVQLTVEDSGTGVPDDVLPRLGQRLLRLDPSRNRLTGGSGLGLSIVAAIVQRHAGTLQFGRAALGGLRVVMTLPAAPT